MNTSQCVLNILRILALSEICSIVLEFGIPISVNILDFLMEKTFNS